MLKAVRLINYNSKLYFIRIFKGEEKVLRRERPLDRQKIIVSDLGEYLSSERGGKIRLQPCRSALRKSIINIFMNASIFVRSFLESNVQFHRCTTIITENSTSASAQPHRRVFLFSLTEEGGLYERAPRSSRHPF